jgi:3'(2'), 5'-bisphosphate nucleotidase
MRYTTERQVAIQAVIDASRLCQSVRAALVDGQTMAKKDRSPVTVADFGAQAIISAALQAAFPDDAVIGEESADDLRTPEGHVLRDHVVSQVLAITPDTDTDAVLAAIDRCTDEGGPHGRHWALDPIDGTKGFLRGDQYAVALGLIEEGEPVFGVLGCPNLPLNWAHPDGPRGCLFVAERGHGTVMMALDGSEARPVRVSEVSDLRDASFVESVESGHSSHGDAARIAGILGVEASPVRIDSQCKYAAVGRGDAAIYLRLPTRKDYEEKVWDHAAGWIVITEAGGRVTDVVGRPLDFALGRALAANKGVIATNGRVHDRVIAAARQVLGTPA